MPHNRRYTYRIFRIEFSLTRGEVGRHPIQPTHKSAEIAQRDCFLHNLRSDDEDAIFVVVKERIGG
jgi:hypothetical protein